MSFKKGKKSNIIDPITGYEKVSRIYCKSHKYLNNWDKQAYKKYLPREMKGLAVVDLGGGDGRTITQFTDLQLSRLTVFDASEGLLKRCKGNVEKVQGNLEDPLPFEDQSFDVALSFFVLIHINNIEQLFEEVYRILKPGGKFIVFHHIERRNHEYVVDGEKFKIDTYNHRYKDIEKLAEYNFFDVAVTEMMEDSVVVGNLYCFSKN